MVSVHNPLHHGGEVPEVWRFHVGVFARIIEISHGDNGFEIGVVFKVRYFVGIHRAALQIERVD